MRKTLIVVAILLLASFVDGVNANDSASKLEEQNVMSTLWYKKSSEAKSLYLQAYNIATSELKEVLQKELSERPAIVLDLDETVLNNSGLFASRIVDGHKSWSEWISEHKETLLPGALDFLKFAHDSGIEVFYITNRDAQDAPETLETLDKLGIPNADNRHVFFKTDSFSKEDRREKIEKNFEVVMYLGDNLGDFSKEFDGVSSEERDDAVQKFASDFGEKFIVFPNPMYGSWEDSIYSKTGLNVIEKITERLKSLQV